MKRKILVLMIGIIILVGTAATYGADLLERNQTYKLPITCNKDQYIFSCPCSEEIVMKYEKKSDLYYIGKDAYLRYVGIAYIKDCSVYKFPSAIRVTNIKDPDVSIKEAMGEWLKKEYEMDKRVEKKQKLSKGRGMINVTK